MYKDCNNTLRLLTRSLIVLLAVVAMTSCGGSKKQQKHKVNPDCVYVCTGPNAKKYHSAEDCKGLSKCSGRVVELTLKEAEHKGKTPCRLCVEDE